MIRTKQKTKICLKSYQKFLNPQQKLIIKQNCHMCSIQLPFCKHVDLNQKRVLRQMSHIHSATNGNSRLPHAHEIQTAEAKTAVFKHSRLVLKHEPNPNRDKERWKKS